VLEDANCNSQPESETQEYRARRLFVGALAVCVLIWVALYNGYPTVFSDTGGYLLTGKYFAALPPFRAPGYALFTRFTSLGISAWLTIAAQAILVAYLLHETLDYLIEDDRKLSGLYFLASVSMLAALTSLPWVVSLLMPDLFAGVVFLSAFLLAFAEQLSLFRRILLASIFMVSVAAHNSLLPIAILFVVAVFVLRMVKLTPQEFSSTRSVMAWLLIPIAAAGLVTASLNQRTGLGFRLSPSRNSFLLARLFGDGLASDYLLENCPQQDFISCGYISDLPQTQEEFLFQHPLFDDLIKGHEAEMGKIIQGTLRAYPLRFLENSARETLLQLASMRTGDEIRTYGAREWNSQVIPLVYPRDSQAFLNGRQYHDRLTSAADASGAADTAVFWLSLATCMFLAWTGRFGRINLFFYSAIVFLVINATVCATFAGVFDRYQSRVAWILPFCLTAYACSWARAWKRWTPLEKLEEIDEMEVPAN
jgi:hypothetical protein